MTTQTKDYATRDANEAKTHELFDFDRNGIEWTPNMAVLALVWKSQHYAAIPVSKIQLLGAVLAGYQHEGLDPEWLKPELTKLVRAKVLRGYSKQGKYLYEVNF